MEWDGCGSGRSDGIASMNHGFHSITAIGAPSPLECGSTDRAAKHSAQPVAYGSGSAAFPSSRPSPCGLYRGDLQRKTAVPPLGESAGERAHTGDAAAPE